MTNTATRLITLIFLLQNKPNQKASDLAGKLGVSPRTLHRYFEMLDEMGIPICSERGSYGGFSLVRGYKMPPLVATGLNRADLKIQTPALEKLRRAIREHRSVKMNYQTSQLPHPSQRGPDPYALVCALKRQSRISSPGIMPIGIRSNQNRMARYRSPFPCLRSNGRQAPRLLMGQLSKCWSRPSCDPWSPIGLKQRQGNIKHER